MDIQSRIKRTAQDDTDEGMIYEVELQIQPDQNVKLKCQGVLVIRSDKPFDGSFVRGKNVMITVTDKAT